MKMQVPSTVDAFERNQGLAGKVAALRRPLERGLINALGFNFFVSAQQPERTAIVLDVDRYV